METRVLTSLFLVLFSTAFVSGCGPTRVIEKPVIHTVTVTEFRNVPADLLTPCGKTIIMDIITYAEALEAWAADRATIDTCNGQIDGIRSLDGD